MTPIRLYCSKPDGQQCKKISAIKQVQCKEIYDRTAKPHKYKAGDLVLLKDKSRYQSKCGKLATPFEGPFAIVQLDLPNVIFTAAASKNSGSTSTIYLD